MKKLLTRLFSVLLIAVLLGTSAAAADPIAVTLDGAALSFPAAGGQPLLRAGRTYVPLRAIFEAMGATVSWDADTQTVTAARGGTAVQLVIGQSTVTVTEQGETRTAVTDAQSFLENGRTYVPVRFAAQAFGANVGWDAAARTVILIDAAKHGAASADDFTVMDRYLALLAPVDSRAVSGTLHLLYTVHAPDGDFAVPLQLRYAGTRDTLSAALDFEITADIAAMTAALAQNSDAVSERVANLLTKLQNASYSCILSRPDSALDLQGPLTDLGVPHGEWVRLPLDFALRTLSGGTLTETALAGLARHSFAQYTAGAAAGSTLSRADEDNLAHFTDALAARRAPYRDSAFTAAPDSIGITTAHTLAAADGALDTRTLTLTTDSAGAFVSATATRTVTKDDVTVLSATVTHNAAGTTAALDIAGAAYHLSATLTETTRPLAVAGNVAHGAGRGITAAPKRTLS